MGVGVLGLPWAAERRMTSRTKPVLPALAVTLAAEGICITQKFKGHRKRSRLCLLSD